MSGVEPVRDPAFYDDAVLANDIFEASAVFGLPIGISNGTA
jgi:hypothetical protein